MVVGTAMNLQLIFFVDILTYSVMRRNGSNFCEIPRFEEHNEKRPSVQMLQFYKSPELGKNYAQLSNL